MQHLRDKPQRGARLNLSHPLSKGLVGCWLMNGQGNREWDYSPYGNHGTLIGFTDPIHTLGQRSSEGIAFDGVDDYVSIINPNGLSPEAENFSINLWFKSSDNIIQSWLYGDYGSNSIDLVGLRIVNNKLDCIFRDGGGDALTITGVGSNVNDSIWHLASCIRNGTTAFLYLDGIQIGTNINNNVGTISVGDGNPPNIGKYPLAGNLLFNGSIAGVLISRRAWSACEVQQHFTNPYCMFME